MRYQSLPAKKELAEKIHTVSEFSLGIDDDNGAYAEDGAVLDDCLNMQYEGEKLTTRKGFEAQNSYIISPGYYDDRVYLPFTITETVYYMNSKPYNLAYSCLGYSTAADMKFFLVDSAGNITPAGSIWFNRVDMDTYLIPVNIFFMLAQKTSGIGVYAFIERVCNGVGDYQVYEASENFASWSIISNSFYVPTVRINGRGDRYEEVAPRYNLNYPEPERPEELNLLSGRFKCYFTSDGFSSVFRLPYRDLEPVSTIKCRLYSATDSYVEWVFSPYESYCTITVDNEDNTLYVNRELGYIRFLGDRSSPYDYYVPIMENCPRNNLMVTATTRENLATEDIVTSKGAVALNNRIYFYGNKSRPNCIYCAKSEKPFYFPQSSKLFLGDSSTGVTSLKVQNGKLIAFKPGEVYRITTTEEDGQFEKESVLPESTLYIKGDVLKAQMIDNITGCSNPDTIRLCGNRLVWLASDNAVYALATTTYGNTTNVYRVSQPLGNRIAKKNQNQSSIFAVTSGGKYILFIGDTVFVMNYKVRGFGYSKTYYAGDDKLKSPAWYIWSLPENFGIYGGTVVGGEAVLTSCFGDGLYYNTVLISGQTDTALVRENGENKTVDYAIRSGFTTKVFDFDCGERLKRLDCVFINGECKSPAMLTLADGNIKLSRHISFRRTGDCLRIGSCMPACREISASLYCDKPFSIRSIAFKYKLLAEKG